jgi:glutathione S-transferase
LSHNTSCCIPNQVICSYLNKVFGWGPPDAQSQSHIDQTLAVVADGVGDGRLAFHPVNFYTSHKTQASILAWWA